MVAHRRIVSWGGVAGTSDALLAPDEFLGAASRTTGGLLPFGNGRSYGDSCINASGRQIDSRRSARILAFDADTGVIEAEAGVLLSEIIAHAAAAGWFPPVLPGTQFVTLGGAIANDIHGKNHHRRGTFGRFVRQIRLERSDRGGVVLTPDQQQELFRATIGGMGLTGCIRSATLQLMRVPSTTIAQTVTRFSRLSDYFELAEEADARHEYAVAWIDSLSSGNAFGRGHLIAGDHVEDSGATGEAARALATVPFTPPVSPLRGPALRLFNALYYRKENAGVSSKRVAFDSFFFPLDRIGQWNRLYGPRGLHQHQSALPFSTGRDAVEALLRCAKRHGHGSFLTVLKRFGDVASPGLLSFPRPGYTLTLDFPHRGQTTLDLLDELDRITVDAGGAVNPYKDRRMSAATFKASFDRWAEVEHLRDPAVLSDFWRRTAQSG